MIIIKVDCCGCPQTSMQFKHLDVLRRYAGERVNLLTFGVSHIL